MKVIDLLNKIATANNIEDIPKKIEYGSFIYERFERLEGTYNYKNCDGDYFEDVWFVTNILNNEVKIVEDIPKEIYFDEEDIKAEKEEMKKLSIEKKDNFYDYYKEDKKIEKLRIIKELDVINVWNASNCDIELATKINEIIDKVNGE